MNIATQHPHADENGWIPIDKARPTKEYANEFGMVRVFRKRSDDFGDMKHQTWDIIDPYVTHWKPAGPGPYKPVLTEAQLRDKKDAEEFTHWMLTCRGNVEAIDCWNAALAYARKEQK